MWCWVDHGRIGGGERRRWSLIRRQGRRVGGGEKGCRELRRPVERVGLCTMEGDEIGRLAHGRRRGRRGVGGRVGAQRDERCSESDGCEASFERRGH